MSTRGRMMRNFKQGDTVYQKSTLRRGRIRKKALGTEWDIIWDDGITNRHREDELYTEEEHEQQQRDKQENKKGER